MFHSPKKAFWFLFFGSLLSVTYGTHIYGDNENIGKYNNVLFSVPSDHCPTEFANDYVEQFNFVRRMQNQKEVTSVEALNKLAQSEANLRAAQFQGYNVSLPVYEFNHSWSVVNKKIIENFDVSNNTNQSYSVNISALNVLNTWWIPRQGFDPNVENNFTTLEQFSSYEYIGLGCNIIENEIVGNLNSSLANINGTKNFQYFVVIIYSNTVPELKIEVPDIMPIPSDYCPSFLISSIFDSIKNYSSSCGPNVSLILDPVDLTDKAQKFAVQLKNNIKQYPLPKPTGVKAYKYFVQTGFDDMVIEQYDTRFSGPLNTLPIIGICSCNEANNYYYKVANEKPFKVVGIGCSSYSYESKLNSHIISSENGLIITVFYDILDTNFTDVTTEPVNGTFTDDVYIDDWEDENENTDDREDDNEDTDNGEDENEDTDDEEDENEDSDDGEDENEDSDDGEDENEDKDNGEDENEDTDNGEDENEDTDDGEDDNEDTDNLEVENEDTDNGEEENDDTDNGEDENEDKDDGEDENENTDDEEDDNENTDDGEDDNENTDDGEDDNEDTDNGEDEDENEDKDDGEDENEDKDDGEDENEDTDDGEDENENTDDEDGEIENTDDVEV